MSFLTKNGDGLLSHLILLYPEENNDPSDCYSFSRNDCYEFMVLYLQGMEEEEQEYGPIHHMEHLMFHIVEEGKILNH